MEISQWENRNRIFCRETSVLTGPRYLLRGEGQGMKHT